MVHAWNPGADGSGRCVRADVRRGARRHASRGSLSLSAVLSLTAISVVVVLVSLPRLRSFALRENEADAVYLLRTVGEYLLESGLEQDALPDLVALLREEPELERTLRNCHDFGEGVVLRHGYLFDSCRPAPGRWALRAWPYRHGQTGRSAFVWLAGEGLREHPNRDAAFDGPDARPDPSSAAGGWRTRVR